jgi:hypothetical protein
MPPAISKRRDSVTQYVPSQPQALNYAPPPARSDIRTIASRQKVLMYCILGYLALIGVRVAVMVNGTGLPVGASAMLSLAALGIALTATVFVFLLATATYNTGLGIVLGFLTLVPLIGLLILLMVNGKATSVLKQHGVKVGIMGARMEDIPEPAIRG